MKKMLLYFGLLILLFCNLSFARFQAGAAVSVVTPDPLLPVSGGIGPSHPTKIARGDLTVRALVLTDGITKVAVVSADFLGFPSSLGNKVRKAVEDIPPENILIGVTHTHSAPDCYGFPDREGRITADLAYIDMVCTRMAEVIKEADEKLQPAVLKIATGEARGKIAYNAYAEQLYDPRCHVLQALDHNGKAIATLVNYAVHPEVLGSERGILSPDLCGPFYERIEEMGGGVAVFMNSAQGGMVTADNRDASGRDMGTWDECVRIGRLLAEEALRVVNPAPLQEQPAIFCAARKIAFPVDSPLLRHILEVSPIGAETDERGCVVTQLNLLNIGNAQMLTIPGEALPNIGYYLKRNMKGKHNFLFGLTNDGFGYLLTRVDWRSFKRYDYISETCLGEMTGEIYIEEALKLVNSSPLPEKL